VGFFAHFTNALIYVLHLAGFIKLMLSLWLDASIAKRVIRSIPSLRTPTPYQQGEAPISIK
jgi:hypothetical protein